MFEYEVEGMFEGVWELLTCEVSLSEARDRVDEYRLNVGGRYRIRRVIE